MALGAGTITGAPAGAGRGWTARVGGGGSVYAFAERPFNAHPPHAHAVTKTSNPLTHRFMCGYSASFFFSAAATGSAGRDSSDW
jgi:hypothetical protein